MAARTGTKLYRSNTGTPLAIALYQIPNVTTADTFDTGSTGTNDFTKVFLALQVPVASAAYVATTLANATLLNLTAIGLTGEDCLLLVIGAST